MKRVSLALPLIVFAAMLVPSPTSAQTTIVIIDESTGSCNNETGCTAALVFSPTAGQLLLEDSNGLILDVVTFGNGGYSFASDNIDGFDDPADTFLRPADVSNQVTLAELANGGAVVYTPSLGQPGFALDNADHPVTYDISSDSDLRPVPEPSTLILLGSGLFAFACRKRAGRSQEI